MFHSPSSNFKERTPPPPLPPPPPPRRLISGWTPSFSQLPLRWLLFYFYIYPLLFLVLWHRKKSFSLQKWIYTVADHFATLFLPNIVISWDSSVFLHVWESIHFYCWIIFLVCRYYQNVFILLKETLDAFRFFKLQCCYEHSCRGLVYTFRLK